jgi:hypothetical protein
MSSSSRTPAQPNRLMGAAAAGLGAAMENPGIGKDAVEHATAVTNAMETDDTSGFLPASEANARARKAAQRTIHPVRTPPAATQPPQAAQPPPAHATSTNGRQRPLNVVEQFRQLAAPVNPRVVILRPANIDLGSFADLRRPYLQATLIAKKAREALPEGSERATFDRLVTVRDIRYSPIDNIGTLKITYPTGQEPAATSLVELLRANNLPQCKLADADVKQGCVGPVHPEEDLSQLVLRIRAHGMPSFSCQRRLDNRGQPTASILFKVAPSEWELRNQCKECFSEPRVTWREFVPPKKVCSGCHAIGHRKADCSKPSVCGHCAQPRHDGRHCEHRRAPCLLCHSKQHTTPHCQIYVGTFRSAPPPPTSPQQPPPPCDDAHYPPPTATGASSGGTAAPQRQQLQQQQQQQPQQRQSAPRQWAAAAARSRTNGDRTTPTGDRPEPRRSQQQRDGLTPQAPTATSSTPRRSARHQQQQCGDAPSGENVQIKILQEQVAKLTRLSESLAEQLGKAVKELEALRRQVTPARITTPRGPANPGSPPTRSAKRAATNASRAALAAPPSPRSPPASMLSAAPISSSSSTHKQ